MRCPPNSITIGMTDTEHDQHQDQVDVVADERDLAEEVAGHQHAGRPHDTADDADAEVPAAVHPADAGDRRDERADDRHEPRQQDRARPVALEERVRAVHVLALEQLRVLLVEQLRADPASRRRNRRRCPARRTRSSPGTRSTAACARCPCAMNRPSGNSSESPGRKNPISRPHSAKMMIAMIGTTQRTHRGDQVIGVQPLGPQRDRRGNGGVQHGTTVQVAT